MGRLLKGSVDHDEANLRAGRGVHHVGCGTGHGPAGLDDPASFVFVLQRRYDGCGGWKISRSERKYDFDAMDKQLLGQARKSYGSSKSTRGADAPERSSAESAPPGSVAEARRLRGADAAADQKQVLDYLRQAERAKARGKLQVAKVLYQMAERRASGELKADVRRKLAALNRAPAAESVSKSK